jgi:hypothetical protein
MAASSVLEKSGDVVYYLAVGHSRKHPLISPHGGNWKLHLPLQSETSSSGGQKFPSGGGVWVGGGSVDLFWNNPMKNMNGIFLCLF